MTAAVANCSLITSICRRCKRWAGFYIFRLPAAWGPFEVIPVSNRASCICCSMGKSFGRLNAGQKQLDPVHRPWTETENRLGLSEACVDFKNITAHITPAV